MENAGEAADDQGSGWFEVKKKHRCSSKFSVQNWAGGFSTRRLEGKSANSQGKYDNHVSKSNCTFTAHVQGHAANHSSMSKENERCESCLDKCVVNEDSACLNTPDLRTISVTNSTSAIGNEDVSYKKAGAAHNIKWGDLEDDAFTLHLDNQAASGIRFGEIGDDDLAMCKLSQSSKDLVSSNSFQKCPEGNKDVVKIIDTTHDTEQKSSLESCKENFKEVTTSLSCVEGTATSRQILDPGNCAADYQALSCGDVQATNNDSDANTPSDEKFSRVAIKEPITVAEVRVLIPSSSAGDVETPKVTPKCGNSSALVTIHDSEVAPLDSNAPEMCGNSSTLLTIQDSELTPLDSNAAEISRESNTTLGVGECRVLHDSSEEVNITLLVADNSCLSNDKHQDNVSRARIMNALGEEEGESKERFRERLWCFLFENLNRAVDELYLLCELECDIEQVKEAILVLEEATSDFRELNTRVEEFEKLKKNSSKLIDGLMPMKSDHRRPHALSWEVRRMTTSPHRAEILSSSLEAFKKIQQERAKLRAADDANIGPQRHSRKPLAMGILNGSNIPEATVSESKSRRPNSEADLTQENVNREKRSVESVRSTKASMIRNNRTSQSSSASEFNTSKLPPKGISASVGTKSRREQLGSVVEVEKSSDSVDQLKRQNATNDKEKEKEKRTSISWKSMDAWKERRNWEEILASPCRISSRLSHSPFMGRRSAERARILHDKLMSPEKRKKTALDLKKEAEEKHARARRIRSELENEKVQRLQRTSEKLNRVNEWQAVRNMKLREGMHVRHQRGESRHEAYIAQVVKRAGDESIKVNEVRFITSLNEENKKLILRQKLHDSEMRRAEKLQVLKTKQKEDMAREEAVLERRKLIEAEKLQRLAETQRKKEEAQARREEERKASSAAREAKAMEQLRRREERAKAQQEEAELLAQKLAERLSESEQRRKIYLEQIRERASMDFRDQSSPLLRRVLNKEVTGRLIPINNCEDNQVNGASGSVDSPLETGGVGSQQTLKRRIKKIRQRLMALKHGLSEPTAAENSSFGYRTAVTSARAKIGRWLQDLQRHRQERKEGATSIGLITAEMIKFLEGKELELHASRQAGLLDFISSALPASYISKPEACQVTMYLLKLLRVVLSVSTNRSYFLAQNLLPPIIPMLSAALESYIKIAASLNIPGSSNLPLSKTSSENFDSMSEVLDGFLWTISMIIGQETLEEQQLQMQDGLLELVISYQIIHRLRDLFALYDRPQAEGSPFPSSILLSINLLVALTSRPRIVSCIDWDSLPIESVQESEVPLVNVKENADSGSSFATDSPKEHRPPSSVLIGSSVVLPGVGDDELFGQSCKTGSADASTSTGIDSQVQMDNSTEINIIDGSGRDSFGCPQDLSIGVSKSCIPQKDEKNTMDIGRERKDDNSLGSKQPLSFLLCAISETGLVSLLSPLTAVLLQANNRLSSEQASYVLPSNFEEVATGVLKVLNNLASRDISFMQDMLARLDLKIEFFHIMSFLLTHCTSSWKGANDRIGLLLLESLLVLGHFSLFHPGNQAVLRWGKGPTILHKVCDLPFVFFSDPELMPILGGTLVAACFGCEQNKGVVQQELSTEMLLLLIRSCRNNSHATQSSSPPSQSCAEESAECTSLSSESKKPLSEPVPKSSRLNGRNSRALLTKSTVGNISRIGKSRNQKEGKTTRSSEELTLKQKVAASETTVSALMLHSRFPVSFIDRAEQFFAVEINAMDGAAHA
ncbi:hypothetical protein Ancab_038825 [Ancistrocladus abbreviatus]